MDRNTGSYTISIGNAIKSTYDVTSIIVISSVTVIFLIFLVYIVVRLVELKKERLEAEEWIQSNEEKLIAYASLVDSETSDKIRSLFKLKKEFVEQPAAPSSDSPKVLKTD